MDKASPNHFQEDHIDNKLKLQQGESQREIRIMGASSDPSPPLSSYLSSSNNMNSLFTTDITTSPSSPPVRSFRQEKITIEHAKIKTDAESGNKRRNPIGGKDEDIVMEKRYRYDNMSNSANIEHSHSSFFASSPRDTTNDFASEFLDSDNSSTGSEEEVETPQVAMHENIENQSRSTSTSSLQLACKTPIPNQKPSVICNVDKGGRAVHSYAEAKPLAPASSTHLLRKPIIKEEETPKITMDQKYPKIDYMSTSLNNVIPSQCISSIQRIIMAQSNVSSSAIGKISDHRNISLDQRKAFQVVSSTDTSDVTATKRVKSKKNSLLDTSIGRWTRQEHEAFLLGLKEFGREWKKVAYKIPTRTSAQIRSHAQKYFAKIARDEQQHAAALSAPSQLRDLSSGDDTNTNNVTGHTSDNPLSNLSPAIVERFHRILKDPDTARREVEETLCRLRNRYSELQRAVEQKQLSRLEPGDSNNPNVSPPSSVGNYNENNSSAPSTSVVSNPIMTVPSETQQNNLIVATKKDRVVDPEDVRRYIDSDEGLLARKELIALHVLGSTLHRSVSQDNIFKDNNGTKSIANSNAANQTTATGTGFSIKTEENHSSESTQENDSTAGLLERNNNQKPI